MARQKQHGDDRTQPVTVRERASDILDAARDEFIAKGFAAARIEDVAKRAGVAKGTVYLHFASKEDLFKALIKSVAAPPIDEIDAMLQNPDLSSADVLRGIVAILDERILRTGRRHILRLLLTEGHNFPEIAGFYYDEVVARAMRLLRQVVERGVERGEISGDALARFPQLLAAPMVLAIIWEGVFGQRHPLDTGALLEAHVDMLIRALEAHR